MPLSVSSLLSEIRPISIWEVGFFEQLVVSPLLCFACNGLNVSSIAKHSLAS